MKYLLVAQSLQKYSDLVEYCMPLGIAYINGAMRQKGFDVDAMNMLFEDNPLEALYNRVREAHIDVLMCGGLTSEYKVLKKVYETAKKANHEIIIVGGGGGFTSEPILFSEMTGVDYAVIGEGEITNCELASALDNGRDISDIKGLVYKKDGSYIQNAPRDYIKNLDEIPFPSYEGLRMEEYLDNQHVDGWYNYYAYYSDSPRMMPMLMARSCPYQCSFCFHPIGKGYRFRSLDNFFRELDLWIESYHINSIALVDECFSIDKNRVIEFCRRIKGYNIKWACQMRAETYTEEVLSAMKESGCIGACFGIESMSETVLRNMNKHLSEQTIENALALTYKYQLGCTGNLIFGAEAETFETIAESLKWHHNHAKKYNNRPVRQFAYVQTYPGSIYYSNACRNGVIKDKKQFIENSDWHINITGLSDEDYQTIEDITRLCRRENYNRGTVLSVSYVDDRFADMTFQCSYCHHVNTYHKVNRLRLSEGKIKRLGCRNCNMLGDYVLQPERYPYDEYLAIPWLLGITELVISTKYFSDNHFFNVGICGMNAFAKKIIGILENIGNINVKFIYDYQLRPDIDYGIIQTKTNEAFSEIDLLINADLAYGFDMKKHIQQFYSGEIIYLEDLLRMNYDKDDFYNG